MKRLLVVLLAAGLAGCASHAEMQTTSATPVCNVLSANADPAKPGPIRYNPVKLKSRRHAGPALAADLAVRNSIGDQLRCPGYNGR
jgi:type IV pilus biogenesis protein CpaD/CtpE